MPSTRPNLSQLRRTRSHLTLDEQSFQNLLSAAFTIQEHNDQQKRAKAGLPLVRGKVEATIVCPQCGALKATEESNCPSCNVGKFRPGERLQRNWASMWLLSQQRELFPDRTSDENEVARKASPDQHKIVPHKIEKKRDTVAPVGSERESLIPATRSAANSLAGSSLDNSTNSGLLVWPAGKTAAAETAATAETETEADAELKTDGSVEAIRSLLLDRPPLREPLLDEAVADEPKLDEPTFEEHSGIGGGIDRASAKSDWAAESYADVAEEDLASENPEQEFQTAEGDDTDSDGVLEEKEKKSLWDSLAHFRVKLRVHRANLYLGAAVSVAALALLWPTASTPQASTLGPMDRALVALGLAEVPAPVAHVKGDPTINVWVDPHTALYYCQGEEQYGKTADGRVSSQHDAQMDRFEPAAGSVCE
jgi:hypothetical protein